MVEPIIDGNLIKPDKFLKVEFLPNFEIRYLPPRASDK